MFSNLTCNRVTSVLLEYYNKYCVMNPYPTIAYPLLNITSPVSYRFHSLPTISSSRWACAQQIVLVFAVFSSGMRASPGLYAAFSVQMPYACNCFSEHPENCSVHFPPSFLFQVFIIGFITS